MRYPYGGVARWRQSRRSGETDSLLIEAHRHLDEGRPDVARRLVKEALLTDMSLPEGLEIGRLLHTLDETQAAVDLFNTLVRQAISPIDQAEVRVALLWVLGRFDEAIEPLRQVVERRPNDAEAHLYLGQALLHIGRYDAARAAARKAAAVAPAWPDLRLVIGRLMLRLGAFDDARATLDGARALEPGDVRLTLAIARLWQRVERFEDALPLFDMALARRPGALDVLVEAGRAFARGGRLDDARRCLVDLERLHPGRADAHRRVGSAIEAALPGGAAKAPLEDSLPSTGMDSLRAVVPEPGDGGSLGEVTTGEVEAALGTLEFGLEEPDEPALDPPSLDLGPEPPQPIPAPLGQSADGSLDEPPAPPTPRRLPVPPPGPGRRPGARTPPQPPRGLLGPVSPPPIGAPVPPPLGDDGPSEAPLAGRRPTEEPPSLQPDITAESPAVTRPGKERRQTGGLLGPPGAPMRRAAPIVDRPSGELPPLMAFGSLSGDLSMADVDPPTTPRIPAIKPVQPGHSRPPAGARPAPPARGPGAARQPGRSSPPGRSDAAGRSSPPGRSDAAGRSSPPGLTGRSQRVTGPVSTRGGRRGAPSPGAPSVPSPTGPGAALLRPGAPRRPGAGGSRRPGTGPLDRRGQGDRSAMGSVDRPGHRSGQDERLRTGSMDRLQIGRAQRKLAAQQRMPPTQRPAWGAAPRENPLLTTSDALQRWRPGDARRGRANTGSLPTGLTNTGNMPRVRPQRGDRRSTGALPTASGHQAIVGGSLGVFWVPRLLEFTRRSRLSGQLELHSLEGDGEVWFRGGNLSGATASNTLSLAQRLRQPSQTTADQRALIGDMVWEPTDGQTLFDRLIDVGLFTRPEVKATVTDQVFETVDELLKWNVGWFTLTVRHDIRADRNAPHIEIGQLLDGIEDARDDEPTMVGAKMRPDRVEGSLRDPALEARIRAQRLAFERQSDDPRVRLRLGQLLMRAGDYVEAIDVLMGGLADQVDQRFIKLIGLAIEGLAENGPRRGSEQLLSVALCGRLGRVNMVQLLELLVREEATGTLRLTATEGLAEIHLVDGALAGATNSNTARLGDLLRASTVMTADQIEGLVARQQASPDWMPIGRLALEARLIDPNRLAALLQKQIRLALLESGRWRGAHFTFELDERRRNGAPHRDLDTAKILGDLSRMIGRAR